MATLLPTRPEDLVYSERRETGRPVGALVQYERPAIVRRERINALLFNNSNSDTFESDVRLKENIVPVAW